MFRVKRHLPGLEIKIRRGQPAEDRKPRPDMFRAMVEGSADLVTRYAPNGEVLYASPSALALTGAEAGALMGQGLVGRVHVADLPAYLKGLSDAFNGRDPGNSTGRPSQAKGWRANSNIASRPYFSSISMP